MYEAMFGEGFYHVIPSFFNTLMHLKKTKREFTLLFRTFGGDKKHFVYEFNKFFGNFDGFIASEAQIL